jgi:DNA-binding IclR family transcriptional regulator
MSKAATHRMLTSLCRTGFAFQNLATRRYCLGAAARMLGRAALAHHVGEIATFVMERLAAASADTVFCSVAEGPAAVCIGRALGSFPIRTLTLDVGDRRPLGVGAGSLALLAALPDDEVEDICRRNELWLRDYRGFSQRSLRSFVQRTRADGYASNEGGIVPQMSAVAIAVMDRNGRPGAALTIAAISERMAPDRVRELVMLLRDEVDELETLLAKSDLQDPMPPTA